MNTRAQAPHLAGSFPAAVAAAPREPVPVSWWPTMPASRADGLYVIGVSGCGERVAARQQIRDALREAIGQLYGLAAADIMIHFSPGVSPSASFSRPTGVPAPGISISHDGTLSVAAIHLHGQVGIDVMRVQDIEDWREVARDYLGPAALARIGAAPAGQRAAVLAHAWTEHEARLKCHGRQLAEWTGNTVPAECVALDLPAPFAGTVARLPRS